jgi:hypothetical protein
MMYYLPHSSYHLKRVKLDRPEVRDDPMDVDSGSLARAETPEEGEI